MYTIHSVDVVPVIESAPSARVPTFTSIVTPPTSHRHRNHTKHHHSRHSERRDEGFDSKSQTVTRRDYALSTLSRGSAVTIKHARSHDSLHNSNADMANLGSNTESQEDLLDSQSKNRLNHHNKKTMGEKSNSGSKVAELISSYEETAKLSQSSSDSVKSLRIERNKGSVESERAKVSRVMSTVTDRAFSKPQTLVLREVSRYM